MAQPSRPPPARPLGFAHRGAGAGDAGNTLAGFGRALELGAGGVEGDAWLTADGVVVLDHDGRVGRGRRRVPIRRLRRAELPARIPSLAELYALCGAAVAVSLDVKDPAAAGPIVAVAGEAGALGQLWLCGAGRSLRRWRALSDAVHLVESTRVARIPEGVAARARRLRRADLDALDLRGPEWRARRVEAVHAAGLLAFAWGAREAAAVAALLALGVDAVYCDDVESLRDGMRRAGHPPDDGGRSEPVQA